MESPGMSEKDFLKAVGAPVEKKPTSPVSKPETPPLAQPGEKTPVAEAEEITPQDRIKKAREEGKEMFESQNGKVLLGLVEGIKTTHHLGDDFEAQALERLVEAEKKHNLDAPANNEAFTTVRKIRREVELAEYQARKLKDEEMEKLGWMKSSDGKGWVAPEDLPPGIGQDIDDPDYVKGVSRDKVGTRAGSGDGGKRGGNGGGGKTGFDEPGPEDKGEGKKSWRQQLFDNAKAAGRGVAEKVMKIYDGLSPGERARLDGILLAGGAAALNEVREFFWQKGEEEEETAWEKKVDAKLGELKNMIENIGDTGARVEESKQAGEGEKKGGVRVESKKPEAEGSKEDAVINWRNKWEDTKETILYASDIDRASGATPKETAEALGEARKARMDMIKEAKHAGVPGDIKNEFRRRMDDITKKISSQLVAAAGSGMAIDDPMELFFDAVADFKARPLKDEQEKFRPVLEDWLDVNLAVWTKMYLIKRNGVGDKELAAEQQKMIDALGWGTRHPQTDFLINKMVTEAVKLHKKLSGETETAPAAVAGGGVDPAARLTRPDGRRRGAVSGDQVFYAGSEDFNADLPRLEREVQHQQGGWLSAEDLKGFGIPLVAPVRWYGSEAVTGIRDTVAIFNKSQGGKLDAIERQALDSAMSEAPEMNAIALEQLTNLHWRLSQSANLDQMKTRIPSGESFFYQHSMKMLLEHPTGKKVLPVYLALSFYENGNVGEEGREKWSNMTEEDKNRAKIQLKSIYDDVEAGRAGAMNRLSREVRALFPEVFFEKEEKRSGLIVSSLEEMNRVMADIMGVSRGMVDLSSTMARSLAAPVGVFRAPQISEAFKAGTNLFRPGVTGSLVAYGEEGGQTVESNMWHFLNEKVIKPLNEGRLNDEEIGQFEKTLNSLDKDGLLRAWGYYTELITAFNNIRLGVAGNLPESQNYPVLKDRLEWVRKNLLGKIPTWQPYNMDATSMKSVAQRGITELADKSWDKDFGRPQGEVTSGRARFRDPDGNLRTGEFLKDTFSKLIFGTKKPK